MPLLYLYTCLLALSHNSRLSCFVFYIGIYCVLWSIFVSFLPDRVVRFIWLYSYSNSKTNTKLAYAVFWTWYSIKYTQFLHFTRFGYRFCLSMLNRACSVYFFYRCRCCCCCWLALLWIGFFYRLKLHVSVQDKWMCTKSISFHGHCSSHTSTLSA